MIPTQILIVDDHAVVREALRAILQREEDFSVMGDARSGREALRKALDLKPDVILMDIRMPGGMSGTEACKRILSKLPATQVVMLTAYPDDDLISEALQAGAVAYVMKRVDSTVLIATIRDISNEQADVDPVAPGELHLEVPDVSDQYETSVFADLSERQLQVLALITRGLTNHEIAQQLSLSDGTVRNYVGTILRTLYVANRAEAAVFAVQHHIERFEPSVNKTRHQVAISS